MVFDDSAMSTGSAGSEDTMAAAIGAAAGVGSGAGAGGATTGATTGVATGIATGTATGTTVWVGVAAVVAGSEPGMISLGRLGVLPCAAPRLIVGLGFLSF